MVRMRVVALVAAGVLSWGCGGRGDAGAGAGGAGTPETPAPAPAAAASAEPAGDAAAPSSSSDRALAEFEPLSAADVEMYLRVMRTAAQRVRDMPAADRQALKLFKAMTSGGGPAAGQMPSAEQMAAIQRAGDLMTLDAVVAQEQGVPKRFSSVQSRVDGFLRPMTGASSGDEHEEMTPEHRAWLQERIRKFRALEQQDAAVLAAHRSELLGLEKQVRLAVHPESMPE